MVLKHTKVELDLIEDKDMYLMVEFGIRGGILTIFHVNISLPHATIVIFN